MDLLEYNLATVGELETYNSLGYEFIVEDGVIVDVLYQ